ncbi:MAG: hypothetical protein JRI56_12105 [Deltaproteobacteria bacterium]|nr:hypothetical protein [Deltaproteobacteria bacterium]
MTRKKAFAEKNSSLVKEFDRYILEHPEFADRLPDNALVVMQIEGDEAAQEAAEKDTPIAYVTITEIKPVRSRIESLRLELAA